MHLKIGAPSPRPMEPDVLGVPDVPSRALPYVVAKRSDDGHGDPQGGIHSASGHTAISDDTWPSIETR